jgi:hypothetical protein
VLDTCQSSPSSELAASATSVDGHFSPSTLRAPAAALRKPTKGAMANLTVSDLPLLSIYLVQKPDVEGHETIAMKEAQCTFVERPVVQGNHRYPQRSTACLGCVQKGSAYPLSACARADTNLVDIDQFVRELPRCLGGGGQFQRLGSRSVRSHRMQGTQNSRAWQVSPLHPSAKRVCPRRLETPRMSVSVHLLNNRIQRRDGR